MLDLRGPGCRWIFHFRSGGTDRFVDCLVSLLFVDRATDCGASHRKLVGQFMDHQERENPFGLSMLKNPDETIVRQGRCIRIEPLTQERGRLVVSNQRIYFKPTFPLSVACEDIDLKNVRRVERRLSHFRDVGLEVATVDDRIFLFSFNEPKDREEIFHALAAQPLDRLRVNSLEQMTHRWQRGSLSTFDYLMFLNWAAGRSMNDLAQYPVLPWVVADYSSDTLDLSNPASFRDLSKPIGALNPQRLRGFIERSNDLRSIGEVPYLYGSHFSNPAYVSYFLIRQRPEYILVLHGGKMDHGSRIFESIRDTYQSVLTGPTDLKELTPEFYFGNGAFLTASSGIDLGQKTDGARVRRDVQLPPWANDSPKEFIRLLRLALESELCSKMIHRWIDLVFGCLQDGSDAWLANNVFHPYCYQSSLTAVKLTSDETLREAIETHTKEFGQMPRKLFFSPHPPRQCGATPASRIELSRFAPPDSDELELTQSSVTFSQGGSDGSPSLAVQQQLRCAEFVAEGVVDQVSPVESSPLIDTRSNDEPPPALSTDIVHASGVLELFQQATHQQQQQTGRGDADDLLLQSQRLVADALDLAHILELESKPPTTTAHDDLEDVQGAEGTASSGSNTHPKSALIYLGHVRTGSKGRVDAIAIADIPCDADWLFEDYDDDVAMVPMVFACDSTGVVHVVDTVLQKRIRTLSDFGPAGITLAIAIREPTNAVLISSLSGSLFVLDLQSCTCQNEYEECCGSSGMTALAANASLAAGGGKSGAIKCWRMITDGDTRGIVLDTNEPSAEFEVPMIRTAALSIDPSGRRILAIQGNDAFVANVDNNSTSFADAITFPLPQHIAKQIVHASFSRDHMILVVGKYDVANFTLDGTEWGSFATPFEVVVAAPSCGGRLSKDALVLASPEGLIAVVRSTTGAIIAQYDIGPELSGAVVVAGSVGVEIVAFSDSQGRIHSLQMPTSTS